MTVTKRVNTKFFRLTNVRDMRFGGRIGGLVPGATAVYPRKCNRGLQNQPFCPSARGWAYPYAIQALECSSCFVLIELLHVLMRSVVTIRLLMRGRRTMMALYQAPSFEALEKLSRSRDADLARRELLDPDRIRGRGAQSNRSGPVRKADARGLRGRLVDGRVAADLRDGRAYRTRQDHHHHQ
jgi:hypothetical protein